MLDVIKNRRSIRTFLDKPVEKEKIVEIIKAGMQAPSAMNQQPWEILVVDDKAMLEQLSQTTPYTKLLAKASIGIVLLMETEHVKVGQFAVEDMSACCENMLLEATNQDLGAVWMGVYPEKDRGAKVKELLNIPDHLEVFNLIAIGYSDEQNRYIDRFNELKVHYNTYQEPKKVLVDKDHKLSLLVNDIEVAYLEYHQEDEHTYCADHTEANPKYRGQGWAKELVKAYEDKLIKENKVTTSNCSYVSKVLADSEYLK